MCIYIYIYIYICVCVCVCIYMKYVNGRRTGVVTYSVETAFYNGLLKERYEGGIKVTGRQGRRRRKVLDDLKERRGYSHLKEEALDRTMWRGRFGRGSGPVVRQTTKRIIYIYIYIYIYI